MSEAYPDTVVDFETVEDQIDSIFNELDLSLRWQRPSILFAIYNTSVVRRSAQDSLEKLILESGQNIIHYQIEYEENLNLTQFVAEITHKENVVFYIDPLNSDEKNSQVQNLISMLNSCRGYLVDHLVRVVFWLTENEALCVAHQAPDFWASRHRVFEFIDEQAVEELETARCMAHQPAKGEKKPMILSSEPNDEDFPGESALVLDLSEGEEPAISGINLLLMMGVANWKEGNHQKATESLQAALALAEKSGNKSHQAMCHKAIALVKSDSGKNDEAIQAYNQVVELGPENVTVWNNIGSLYHKTGRSDEAIKAFGNAIKKDPNDPVSWHGLGNVYASTGRLDEAVGCYRKAIQFNASYIPPWVKLGDVLLRQNRYEDALYAYMRTVEMDNKNVHAWSEIGGIYFKAGSYEQAIGAYKKALILGVDSAVLYASLADTYTHTGNYAEAIQHFQKAIERENDNNEKAVTWNKLGDVHRRIGDYERAVIAYEMADKLSTTVGEAVSAAAPAIKQEVVDPVVENSMVVKPEAKTNPVEQPSLAPVKETQVEASGKIGQPKASLAGPKPVEPSSVPVLPRSENLVPVSGEPDSSASSLPDAKPENGNLWARLGGTYMKAGAMDRAIDAYQKAVSLDSTDGQAYFHLAEAYAQKSESVKAISFYRKSIELFSNNKDKAISLSCIGDLYRQMQEFVNALEAFEIAVSLDPENETILSSLSKFQEDLDQVSNLKKSADTSNAGSGELSVMEVVEMPVAEVAVTKMPIEPVDRVPVKTETQVFAPVQAEPTATPLKINLNNANVWNELGNIFTKSKAYDEAVDAYNRAIELNPEFGWSYSNLALVYARSGNRDEAISLYHKSIGLLWADPDKAVAWNRLGDVYRQAGKYSDAIDAYQNADRLNQGNYVISANREINIEQLFPHFVS
jgi:tetratricopeptide (TPR) repeat protein